MPSAVRAALFLLPALGASVPVPRATAQAVPDRDAAALVASFSGDTPEAFTMPSKWLERSVRARVAGEHIDFAPRVAAMPFSAATPAGGTTAPLLDAGAEADFQRMGEDGRRGSVCRARS